MTRWEGEGNESVYERWDGTLCKWSEVWYSGMGENIERKNSEEFVKKVYVSEIMGPRRRGRPVVRGKDRVKDYMH